MRNGDWKYLQVGENEYLFDLANDEKEEINLQEENRKVFEELKSKYQTWDSELKPYSP